MSATITASACHEPPAERVVITIEDDGKGYELSAVGRGRGLRSMRARAVHIGVELKMVSTPARGTRGTRVTIALATGH